MTSELVASTGAEPRDGGAVRERSLLSLRQLSPARLDRLVERSVQIAAAPRSVDPCLDGSIVATLFETTSTRTRTAFSVAALRLGAQVVSYGPDSLQLNTGESLEDTARVLGLMLDGVVIRTARGIADLDRMVEAGAPPVVNAMAREEHPTQAVCDLATMRGRLGGLEGVSVLYVGEGNNTASALAFALARVPSARLTLYVPPGYGLDPASLASAVADGRATGAQVRQVERPDELPDVVDVVYTTRWQTTGTTKADPAWRELFRPYHVDLALLGRWPDALFMHDLPAHRGEEVTAAVLDSVHSVVWQQAQMKLFSAMAVLERVSGRP